MFKNLKIGVRLGAGFGVVLILLTIISAIAYIRVGNISGEVTDLVNDKFPKTVWANNVVDNINVIARALRNSLLVSKPVDAAKELERVIAARKVISENIEKLEQTIKSEEGKKVLSKVLEARKIYIADQDKFIELQQSGKREEALEFMLTKIRKTQGDYIKAVGDIVEFQSSLMTKVGDAAADVANQTQRLVLIMGLAAILVATGFAWWVTRSITKPLAEAMAVANALSEGNLTVKIDVDSKDETGQLKQSMSNMVAKLSNIISEVNTASEALNNAAGQVSQTAQSLSQSSSEQAASVEETTASIEQMTASINQNTENAKVTDGMASKSATEAVEGG
ncbi:MAG: MCP four helix bundle domain-containing protein, partial [Proteobacteria bacterium]|nr:MCP four helix bundle domain-containing protein [Pseudomonadota bacterium]